MDMTGEKTEYYLVLVKTDDGERYAFNSRTFVVDPALARRYFSRASALRIARELRARGLEAKIITVS